MTVNLFVACVTVFACDWVCLCSVGSESRNRNKFATATWRTRSSTTTSYAMVSLTLFGWYECEDNYRSQLLSLPQAGSESMAEYATRVTDFCSRAYPSYTTEIQLDLAVENFISGLVDVSSREYLQRERFFAALAKLKLCKWHKPPSRFDRSAL